jgi:hypothetical protein
VHQKDGNLPWLETEEGATLVRSVALALFGILDAVRPRWLSGSYLSRRAAPGFSWLRGDQKLRENAESLPQWPGQKDHGCGAICPR